ncbi:MAG: hypothetical protein HY064_02775 [Bacteroidetes bacterium]|nr:hypothetical protein [Bacteroidota bacterium]
MKKEKENTDRDRGGIISSKAGWEDLRENWLSKSFQERLTAIEILRLQFIEMYNKSKTPDLSVFGKR